MNRAETLRVMTLLAQLTGPAPEGDAWDLTANAWAAVLADISEADMLRAVKVYVTGGNGRAPGTWWPKPGELLGLLKPAELTNEAAFALLSPILHRSIPADEVDRLGLTAPQRSALAGLPDAFSRARMSVGEIQALRRPFLAGCQAAEARAANPTDAKVIPMRPEAPRLAVDNTAALTADQLAENQRRVADLVSARPWREKPAPIARGPVDETELRERAREATETARRRFGGAR